MRFSAALCPCCQVQTPPAAIDVLVVGLFVLKQDTDKLKHQIYHYLIVSESNYRYLMAKNKLPIEPMTGKVAYVEDCPDEGDVDTNSVIPQSQKRVNFAVKQPKNRDNDSTLDSGYQSWIGEKNKHKTKTLGKESHGSHRVEIKIRASGKNLERESPPKDNGTTRKRTKEKVRLQPVHDKSRLAVPSRETPEVTINDARLTRDNGTVPGSNNVCDCQECQEGNIIRILHI